MFSSAASEAAQSGRGQAGSPFSGPCSTADSTYHDLANATGGQVFLLRPSEANRIGAILESRLSHASPILTAGGSFTRPEWMDFGVPIDSTITKASFTVTVECKGSVRVLRPSGDEVGPAGGPGITTTELASGRVILVQAPEAGVWHVQIHGLGRYSVSAQADTTLLFDFEFVRLGGRPGHEGLFHLKGQPLAGELQTGRARLDGAFGTANLKLVSESGQHLQALSLSPVPGEERGEFLGTLDPPAEPFRVSVEGVDESGQPYQRIHSTLFRLQTVQVWAGPTPKHLPAGRATTLSFFIRNLGAPGAFKVVVVDNHLVLKGTTATMLTLNTGETKGIEVDYRPPVGRFTSATIVASATSTTTPHITNGAVVELTIADPPER